MSNTTESPYSFTTKIKGDLLTVRGDTADEFADRLKELVTHPAAIDSLTELQALGGTVAAVTTVKEQIPGEVVEATTSAAPAAPAAGVPYEKTNKWGAVFTYGLEEAPELEDGRGRYIKKVWTGKEGRALKAWVDPSDGPEPAAPGASKAKTIWL